MALKESSLVILATGQSNFLRRPDFTWTPAENCSAWNWDRAEGTVGTAFEAIPSTNIQVTEKFASTLASTSTKLRVYVITIAFGGQTITHWLAGASARDMYQDVKNNIEPALRAIGRSAIDVFMWWQGETQTATPETYITDWTSVFSRFVNEGWFPSTIPMLVFGIVPTMISGDAKTDATNIRLRAIVNADTERRRFIDIPSLTASYWVDAVHIGAAGHDLAGTMAATSYMNSFPLSTSGGGYLLRR